MAGRAIVKGWAKNLHKNKSVWKSARQPVGGNTSTQYGLSTFWKPRKTEISNCCIVSEVCSSMPVCCKCGDGGVEELDLTSAEVFPYLLSRHSLYQCITEKTEESNYHLSNSEYGLAVDLTQRHSGDIHSPSMRISPRLLKSHKCNAFWMLCSRQDHSPQY